MRANYEEQSKQLLKAPIYRELYHLICENNIFEAFSNIEMILRSYLSLIVSNCAAERSFSILKRTKNYMRITVLRKTNRYRYSEYKIYFPPSKLEKIWCF